MQAPSAEKKTRAERLRTRLRFASYKVKTNQAGKRDMDVIASFESSDVLRVSSSMAMTSSRESLQHVPNITISSPRREPKFVKANLDPFRPVGKLGQPPVHFAAPQDGSRFSSQTIHGYSHDLTSSPPGVVLPQSISPQQLISPTNRKADHTSTMGEHGDDAIEEGAAAAHRRLQRLKDQTYHAGQRSGSVTTDNAAVGLLELMHGRR